MTFEEYLLKKRIDSQTFAAAEPAQFTAWQEMYAQMHANSFYTSVKMVLNNVRLRYHLAGEAVPKPVAPVAANAAKPTATRRAAPRPAASMQTPPEAPEVTPVPQDAATLPAAKPRPVVRRPAALPTPPVPAEGATETDKAVPDQPVARPRPVVKRPVIPKPDTLAETDKATPASAESIAPPAPEESTVVPAVTAWEPKVARARPIIKRPAALQQLVAAQPAPESTPATETPVINVSEVPVAKPSQARPVIKRPAPAATPPEGEKKEVSEQPRPEATDAATPPPRPRPVMRRPLPKPDDATSDGAGE